MLRILEPEIMADDDQAISYARADFARSNQAFVDGFLSEYREASGDFLDIGCGPCDVIVRLAHARPSARITAVDGSAAMIALGAQAIREAGLELRVTVMQGYIPGLVLPERSFDAVISKDLLHHLPDPAALWNEARRLGRPGAILYVLDLIRPATPQDARDIVERTASNEAQILKQDFFNSLCAAFTMEEVSSQLRDAGLAVQVGRIGDRHMIIRGTLP